MNPNPEGTFSMPSSHTPDALVVAFDDHHAVANAGLALTATLAERLGVEAVVDELVDLGDRPGRRDPPGPGVGRRRRPGRAGADDGPRFDGVRGPRPRQGWGGLRLHPPAWLPPGAGQQGRHRRGASPAHAHRLGQHRPRGRTVRGRAGRSGPPGRAAGPLTLRGDSGFWSAKVLGACRRHAIRFSVTVRQTKLVTAAIAAIGEDAWTDIDYPDGGLPRWPRPPLPARPVVGWSCAAPAWSARSRRCGRIGA